MNTFLELFPLVSLVFALSLIVLIGYALFLRIRINSVKESKLETKILKDRIAPFIKIHRNFISVGERELNGEKERELEERIKSFRLRNRFYRK